MADPTYVKDEISANPDWDLAFSLSEIMNDSAPIGWSRYIGAARCLRALYRIERKANTAQENPHGPD